MRHEIRQSAEMRERINEAVHGVVFALIFARISAKKHIKQALNTQIYSFTKGYYVQIVPMDSPGPLPYLSEGHRSAHAHTPVEDSGFGAFSVGTRLAPTQNESPSIIHPEV